MLSNIIIFFIVVCGGMDSNLYFMIIKLLMLATYWVFQVRIVVNIVVKGKGV